MGKRGPKRRLGAREPSGRLDRRTTIDRLNEANTRDQEQTMAVVLAQPHRRGKEGKVSDRRLGYAAGRFCRLYGLARAVEVACEDYLEASRRWLSGYGAPRGHERHDGGSGAGPTSEQMAKWLSKINRVETTIRYRYGRDAYAILRRLVIEDIDITTEDHALVRSMLCDVAVALDFMEQNPHPFGGF